MLPFCLESLAPGRLQPFNTFMPGTKLNVHVTANTFSPGSPSMRILPHRGRFGTAVSCIRAPEPWNRLLTCTLTVLTAMVQGRGDPDRVTRLSTRTYSRCQAFSPPRRRLRANDLLQRFASEEPRDKNEFKRASRREIPAHFRCGFSSLHRTRDSQSRLSLLRVQPRRRSKR